MTTQDTNLENQRPSLDDEDLEFLDGRKPLDMADDLTPQDEAVLDQIWASHRPTTNHKPGGKDHDQSKHGKRGKGKTKSQIAKASAVRIALDVQRYSEDHNEPQLAKAVDGEPMPNNEPMDVETRIRGRLHGIELKTMVVGTNRKLTMKRKAMERKLRWEVSNDAWGHTVVFDDTLVFNANGPGQHDESKRRIFYRRGYGSFRVDSMMELESMDQIKTVLGMSLSDLPKSAGGEN